MDLPRTLSRAALIGLGLLALPACKAKSRSADGQATRASDQDLGSEAPGDQPTAALEVAVSNCRPIVRPEGRRCYLGRQRKLQLWVPGRGDASYELRLDGEPLAANTLLARQDLVVGVEVSGPGRLELELGTGERWASELVESSEDARELHARVTERFKTEGPESALALLAAERGRLSPDESALLSCFEAQAQYGSDALPALADALAESPAVGCWGLAHVMAAYGHMYDTPDYNQVRVHLEAAAQAGRSDYPIGLSALYHGAALALSVGEIDEAIERLRRTVELGRVQEDTDQFQSAQVTLAVALARLGRFDEAEAIIAALEAELEGQADESPLVAEILDNIAWFRLLRREDDDSIADPTPILERLRAAYAKAERDEDRARTALHLALAATQSGEIGRAEGSLDAIDTKLLTPTGLVWFELVAARVDAGRGELDEARAHHQRARLYADLNEDPELDWRVARAEAELARATRDPATALAAYEEAARIADQLALAVPGSAGRSLAVTSRSRVDAEHIELLLDEGEAGRAFCVAAGTRARHLRALWARLRPPLTEVEQREYQSLLSQHAERRQALDERLSQAWSLSETELAALQARAELEGQGADKILERATDLLERSAPKWDCEALRPQRQGVAVLTMAASPRPDQWWFMLQRSEDEPLVVGVERSDPAATGEQLAAEALDSLGSALAELEVLIVVPVGQFVAVDFHRLSLARPELAGLRVDYSLGLGRPRDQARDRPQASAASVVAGATNLDAVRREVEAVGAALERRGWTHQPSWSPSADQPALLHYAGHGHREGLGGWSSYIEVPGAGRVSAAQIVASQRAPELVVLGACSAGEADAEIIDGGMNLAAAFLLAGARAVIAPSGPVEDTTAVEVARFIYDTEQRAPKLDAEQLATKLAQLQRRELAEPEPPLGPRSTLRWRTWVP